MQFEIPESLKHEHEELHAELKNIINAGGKAGEAAMRVADILHPHFVKEEEYAMPPLGLLSVLAEGRVTPEMKDVVLPMTDKLRADLPRMLEEHKAIVASLKNLMEIARREGKMEHARFLCSGRGMPIFIDRQQKDNPPLLSVGLCRFYYGER